jgi:hypothetical protein
MNFHHPRIESPGIVLASYRRQLKPACSQIIPDTPVSPRSARPLAATSWLASRSKADPGLVKRKHNQRGSGGGKVVCL